MATRLVNNITGADRVFPDRLAKMLVGDKARGWAKPPTKKAAAKKAADETTTEGK